MIETAVGVTFLLVLTIIIGAYWAFILRTEEREQGQVRKRLIVRGDAKAGGSLLRDGAGLMKEIEHLSTIGFLDSALKRTGAVTRPLQYVLAWAGVGLNVGVVVLMSICGGLVAYVVAWYFRRSILIGLLAMGLALCVPYLVLRLMSIRRLRQFEEHFPEAVDIVARTLRAGHAFTTGLKLVAEELPEPVSTEFKILSDQQSFGMPLDEALKNFALRIPVLDARFFVTAVLTQREAGGNLAEVLDNLSHVIRERFKVKRQVRAVSAHGRITGWVLAGMPIVMALVMLYNSPDYFDHMLTNPIGVRLAIGAGVLQVVGALAIRGITNIRY